MRNVPVLDSLTQLGHQIVVVVQIMVGHQHSAQHFSAAVEVMQISAGEIFAGIALTAIIDRLLRVFA